MSEKNKDYYTLAGYFSDVSCLKQLDTYMEQAQLSFFDAMQLAAGHIFIRFCLEARRAGKKVLLIEDGGYLAPFLTEFALSGQRTRDVFRHFQIEDIAEEEMFEAWLTTVVIGTIEHTKNGHDRLQRVRDRHASLLLPAYSIAISRDKTVEESQEVAHSIMSAVESVLHGQGMVLSQRKVMVLGADGNIGRRLCAFLRNGRLHIDNQTIAEVDIRFDEHGRIGCHNCIEAIPDDLLLSRDLFIGVVGESILKREHVEKIVLQGLHARLIFASGSTKTVEFSDLSDWLYEISSHDTPRIAGIPVEIEYDRIIDPQSGIDQGGRVFIRFCRQGQTYMKELLLLSDLSPVNFLFYGVPTETMDMVLSQLLRVSLGMYQQSRTGTLPRPGLYAVDHEIDTWGRRTSMDELQQII